MSYEMCIDEGLRSSRNSFHEVPTVERLPTKSVHFPAVDECARIAAWTGISTPRRRRFSIGCALRQRARRRRTPGSMLLGPSKVGGSCRSPAPAASTRSTSRTSAATCTSTVSTRWTALEDGRPAGQATRPLPAPPRVHPDRPARRRLPGRNRWWSRRRCLTRTWRARDSSDPTQL